MKENNKFIPDFLFVLIITVSCILVSLCILYGIIKKTNWMFYPERDAVLGDFFRYNYTLKKYFGEYGIIIANVAISLVLIFVSILIWYDLLNRK